ncbi:hypothetical protein ES703_112008 [subsurface metagenome]
MAILAGVIGQGVYGAGMAPPLAAVAYQEVAPGVEAIKDGDAMLVTFSGMGGRSTPVQVFGVATVEGVESRDRVGARRALQSFDDRFFGYKWPQHGAKDNARMENSEQAY